MSDRMDIQNVLSQIRSIRSQVAQPALRTDMGGMTPVSGLVGGVAAPQSTNFKQLFTDAIGQVNQSQMEAKTLSNAYEMGDPDVSLTKVMIASEKASVSFQALTQVRNKMISAYQDIMNMPI